MENRRVNLFPGDPPGAVSGGNLVTGVRPRAAGGHATAASPGAVGLPCESFLRGHVAADAVVVHDH